MTSANECVGPPSLMLPFSIHSPVCHAAGREQAEAVAAGIADQRHLTRAVEPFAQGGVAMGVGIVRVHPYLHDRHFNDAAVAVIRPDEVGHDVDHEVGAIRAARCPRRHRPASGNSRGGTQARSGMSFA